MTRFSWTLRSCGLALSLVAGLAVLKAEMTKFTHGEMQFKVGAEQYQIPLSRLADASYLSGPGGGKGLLGLVYTGVKPQGPVTPNARFAVNINGPGKYDKSAIMNFVVQTGIRGWNFTRNKDDCAINIIRADTSGVEGTVTCTTPVPFSEMKFNAKP